MNKVAAAGVDVFIMLQEEEPEVFERQPSPGGATWLVGEATADLNLGMSAAPAVPYTTPGSINRSGCGKGLSEEVELPQVSMAEAWVHEDLINHFLYITWRGGLAKLNLTDEIVGPYLGDLGISNVDMSAELTLPPPAVAATLPRVGRSYGPILQHLARRRYERELRISRVTLRCAKGRAARVS